MPRDEEFEEEDQTSGSLDESQAGEGYKCSCGYITDDRKKFVGHIISAKRDKNHLEWHEVDHRSLGRVNLQTGEITMPPVAQRTPDQLKETYHGKKKEKGDRTNLTKTTETLANATEIRLIPRIYTIDYTPIMRIAQEAAVREWGWRQDMPLANFIDTVIYNYFREHGLKIGTYTREIPEPVGVSEE